MASNFSIGLFECGECGPCLYSCCCPACAMASSRSSLDNSDWLFNCLCVSLPVYRWMVRSAYGIGDPDSCCDDCMLSICCQCCTVNQLYQTTLKRGIPVNDGGKDFNINEAYPYCDTSRCEFATCLYAFFCRPCADGDALQKSVGLPWFLGCLFTSNCAARNIARYQYRMAPTICPGCECCADSIFFLVPFSGLCHTVSLTYEGNQKGNMSSGRKGYLVGYKQLTAVQPVGRY